MKILSLVGIKGGIGKTTLSFFPAFGVFATAFFSIAFLVLSIKY